MMERKRPIALGLFLGLTLGGVVIVSPSESGPASRIHQLALGIQGAEGTATQPFDDSTCEESSNSRRLQATTHLAPGILGKTFPVDVGVTLDVAPDASVKSYLGPDASHVVFSTQRGALGLILSSGTCQSPTLSGGSGAANGSGTWSIDPTRSSGGFAGVTGNGTLSLNAELAPGARNAWKLDLNGQLVIPQPNLSITWIRSYWGQMGTDWTRRRATVVYRITNDGPGSTYGAKLLAVGSPIQGITAFEFAPLLIGDLDPGEYIDVRIRFRLDSRDARGPLVTRRELRTSLSTIAPDVLDEGTPQTSEVVVITPSYPPAL